MPIKSDPDNLVHFDIFGDAYAELLSAPKLEPITEQPADLKLDLEASLQISDVRTIGTGIKIETDVPHSTIVSIDPHCVIHGDTINTPLHWILYKRQQLK